MELSKLSAAKARDEKHSVINLADLIADYDEFGRNRIEDTVAEFKHQCSVVGELIDAFKRQPEEMSTDYLLGHINKFIVQRLHVLIAGTPGRAQSRDIASFLFEVGLYFGRRDYHDGSYAHVRYADMPTLLKSRTSLDAGLRWEIHPVFRQALEMRDSEGERITDARLIIRLREALVDH